MQKTETDLQEATNLFKSLLGKFESFSDSENFNDKCDKYFEISASSWANFYESNTLIRKHFESSYMEILSVLIKQLKFRLEKYQYVVELYRFIFTFRNDETSVLEKKVTSFYEAFPTEIESSSELLSEIDLFKSYISSEPNNLNCKQMLIILVENPSLKEALPNLFIVLRMFLSLMITNANGERAFSRLKRIKNENRSTMTQNRLHLLSLLYIERDITKDLQLHDILEEFKIRKVRNKFL